MKLFCILNPKTNRCITNNTENETSYMCKYENSTKRCSSIKSRQSTKKKALTQPLYTLFVERKSPINKKTLKRTINQKSPTLKVKKPKIVDYYGHQVESPVKTYLNKLVFKAPVKNMRKIAQDMNLYIPLNDYPTDKKVREYLVYEILDLAQNDARDSFRSNIIVIENVKRVIKDDHDLSALFMHDPEYGILFEKTPGGIHYQKKQNLPLFLGRKYKETEYEDDINNFPLYN